MLLSAGLFLLVLAGAGCTGCGDRGGEGRPSCVDRDGDGYGNPAAQACLHPEMDCDDSDPLVHPGAAELCDNRIDDDCDGFSDLLDPECLPRPFSFVVLADPHIAGSPDHEQRLLACVEWVSSNRDAEGIELVFIAGDIGWGTGGLARAKEILDLLAVPYVPILGDNEVQLGSEEEFDAVFGPHYGYLATVLDNWQKPAARVWNPEVGRYSWLQNFSFDHRGVHFMGIDWCTRVVAPLIGEQADLHDFPGGTWPWFTEDIRGSARNLRENTVMFSHHPMHAVALGAFTAGEDRIVGAFTGQYWEYLYANLAGHYHIYWHESLWPGGYELFVTEAVWFGQTSLRLVKVSSDGAGFAYQHRLIYLPAGS